MKKAKHEKLIIPKGGIRIFKKVIATIKREDVNFKQLMASLPPIQKLPTHYYVYVPMEYVRRIVDKYDDEIYSY